MPDSHTGESARSERIAGLASAIAFGSALFWVACVKIDAAPWLLWSGLAVALVSSAGHISIYWLRRVRARSARPPASTSITGLPAPAGSVSEHRVAAAMVGILGASLSMAALRAQAARQKVRSVIQATRGCEDAIFGRLRNRAGRRRIVQDQRQGARRQAKMRRQVFQADGAFVESCAFFVLVGATLLARHTRQFRTTP